MPRSLKKGPFIDNSLLIKVNEAQASRSSQVIKTWSRPWWVINWGNFRPHGRFTAMPAERSLD